MNWLFKPGVPDELVEDIYMHTLTLAIFAAIRRTPRAPGDLAQRTTTSPPAYRCVYTNVETGQKARGSVEAAMRTVLGGLADRALITLGDDFVEANLGAFLAAEGPHGALRRALTRWSLTAAAPSRATWWSSTATGRSRGTRSSTGAGSPRRTLRDRMGR